MKKIKENIVENIIVVILTIFTEFISINFVRPKVFTGFISSNFSYWFMNISFIITLLIVYKSIIYIFKKIKLKDKFYMKIIKYSIIYFVFILIFLFIIYPGTWLYDEFWIIEYAINYILACWQSYISVILFTFSLYLIPNPIGILIFQLLGISIVVGYMQTRLSYYFNKKIYNVIMYILFFTPVFLINNLYTLRSTLYAYVVLLFFSIVIFDYLEKKSLTKKKLIILLFLTFLMVTWRSEGIVFLVFNIISLILVYPKVRSIKKISIIVIAIVVSTLIYSKICSDKMYTATITVLPLSIMLNEDLQGKTIEQDIENINKVFNVERMKSYPNYHFMEGYWDGMIVQNNANENINIEFYKSFVNIVMNNLCNFLDIRCKVFLYTFENIEYPNNCYRAYLTNWTMPEIPTLIIANTVEKFNFRALNIKLKINIESFLIENKIIKIIFWNIIPLLIVISFMLIMMIKIIKKEWLIFIIILSLFSKMFITFFTSTASYFMYYFTEYVIGVFLICLFLFKLIEKYQKRRKNE